MNEEEYKSRIVSLEKELSDFSYSVSHDLRAPLRAIDGFSQAILEDYYSQLDEKGKRWLTKIRDASQYMGHLLDDLVILSRIARQEMRIMEVNLSVLAKDVADELKKSNSNRDIEFVIQEGLMAQGDKWFLKTVFEQTFDNACKFTSRREKARIEFGVKDGVYFVSDNGCGFDMAYADKLFSPFQQLHSKEEFPQGTGIGLAIVQRIIHRHQGKIWTESQIDKGTKIYWTLGNFA
ncbi:MAG: ATP-binding protein [bacterium]